MDKGSLMHYLQNTVNRTMEELIVPYKKYYDWDIGKIAFSRIIFQDSKQKAMLYYEFICGGKCGFGEVLLVEEIGKRWVFRGRQELWIS